MSIVRTAILTVVAFLVVVTVGESVAQDTASIQASISMSVEEPLRQESSPGVAESSSCDLMREIGPALTALSSQLPDIGDKRFSYTEVRSGKRRAFSDVEKEFALAVLHTDTCQTEIITILKRGDDLIAPDGWKIEVPQRQNGIRWNNWNTAFRITKPANAVVIANVEPFKERNATTRLIRTADGEFKDVKMETEGIDYRMYVPYSPDLHATQLVEAGWQYIDNLVVSTFNELERKRVPSQAVPGALVTEVPVFTHDMFKELPLIEQMGMGEFIVAPERTAERVFILFGTNQERAFKWTCNSAGACGAYQFTDNRWNGYEGTYTTIRQKYPEAHLIRDFLDGAADHRNIAQMAMLLYDHNLGLLLKRYGQTIMEDPRLREYLAALYNASPARVFVAIDAALDQGTQDWTTHLPARIKTETGGYIAKLRFLQEWARERQIAQNPIE